MYELSKSRCKELAALPKLRVHHFEELTGAAICEGGSFAVRQKGVFPRQYSDHDLRLLFPEERRLILEEANRPPLKFPCTQRDLLRFIDDSLQGSFEVPVEFRRAIETPTSLAQKAVERNAAPGAPVKAWTIESGGATTHKVRRNLLDAPIQKAVELAGNTITAEVFTQLKDIAISGQIPFTGLVDGDSLCYTNDNNKLAKLSKDALRKRLNRQ